MDITHGDIAEKQLDTLIERRSRKGEVDPDEREELWKESVRRYNARRQEENRLAWCDYFSHLAGALRTRAAEYDQRAQALMEIGQRRKRYDDHREATQEPGVSRGNIYSRLEKLEASARSGPSGRCPECGLSPHGPGRIVLFGEAAPHQTLPDNPEERCGSCGRPLWCVLKVVYEDTGGEDTGGNDAA